MNRKIPREDLLDFCQRQKKSICIQTSQSVSRLTKLEFGFGHMHRVQKWQTPTIHREVFVTGWIVFVAISVKGRVGVRIGKEVQWFGEPLAIFLPAFQLLEWHIEEGEVVWEAFRYNKSDGLISKRGFCFDWPKGKSISCKSDLENIINSISKFVPLDGVQTVHSVALKAKAFIDQNFEENLTIPEIARLVGVSYSTMTHYFKNFYGIPPKKYRDLLRLARGIYLISNEDCPTTQACFKSGFSDYSAFKNLFRKRFGVAPSQYLWARYSRQQTQTGASI